jgi:hypothetical protein
MHDISYWEDSLGVTHRQQTNLKQCLEHLERFLYETKTSDLRQQQQQEPINSNTTQSVYNNNTSADANSKAKVYTDTPFYAHADAGTYAHESQIQAQTPSDAIYNPVETYSDNENGKVDDNNTVMFDAEPEVDIVTAAENLRFAAESLAQITGREGADVEDVLGVVFEKYARFFSYSCTTKLTIPVATDSASESEILKKPRSNIKSPKNLENTGLLMFVVNHFRGNSWKLDYSSCRWSSSGPLYPPRPESTNR